MAILLVLQLYASTLTQAPDSRPAVDRQRQPVVATAAEEPEEAEEVDEAAGTLPIELGAATAAAAFVGSAMVGPLATLVALVLPLAGLPIAVIAYGVAVFVLPALPTLYFSNLKKALVVSVLGGGSGFAGFFMSTVLLTAVLFGGKSTVTRNYVPQPYEFVGISLCSSACGGLCAASVSVPLTYFLYDSEFPLLE